MKFSVNLGGGGNTLLASMQINLCYRCARASSGMVSPDLWKINLENLYVHL